MPMLILLGILMMVQGGNCIFGYDCGTKLTNLTTVSLIDIGECEPKKEETKSINIEAQLLQINDYNIIHARECRIKIKRTVHHCGMHSHTSAVLFGEIEYFKEITKDECEGIQLTGTFNGFGLSLMHLERNSTTTKSVILAGKLDKDSHCESGANYDDPYGTFTDVLVTGYVSIGIYDYDIKLNLESDKVFMQDGTPCNAKARHCISGEGVHALRYLATQFDFVALDNCELVEDVKFSLMMLWELEYPAGDEPMESCPGALWYQDGLCILCRRPGCSPSSETSRALAFEEAVKQEARTFLGGLDALVEHEPLVSAPAVIDLDEQSSSPASEVIDLDEQSSSPASEVIVLDEESPDAVLDVVDLDEESFSPEVIDLDVELDVPNSE
ncbi:hypothetical protein TKK_0007830 [Trichogramma kaykai]